MITKLAQILYLIFWVLGIGDRDYIDIMRMWLTGKQTAKKEFSV